VAIITAVGASPFNGGTITNRLTLHPAAGVEALTISGQSADGTLLIDATATHTTFTVDSDGTILYGSDDTPVFTIQATGGTNAHLNVTDSAANVGGSWTSNQGIIHQGDSAYIRTVSTSGAITAGLFSDAAAHGWLRSNPPAPATANLGSGVGGQLSVTQDVHSYTPVTFNPTAGAAATCLVQIGYPPTPTYVTLWTETEPAGIALDGTIHGLNVYVPVGWYLKLTATNATIGTTTYY